MSGNNGNNKKERAQTKWTFIFESDQVSEKFKAGDVIVSPLLSWRTSNEINHPLPLVTLTN